MVSDREGVDQRIAHIERLHGRIVVVQRVGPQPGGGERERAVGACGREADLLPGIVRIVDVGEIEVAGIGRRARRSVGNTAGFDHRAGGFAADHCSVVGAADDDDDDLRSAVDRRDGERIAQYLPDIARLHVRIAVVQRVGPQPGVGERIGAVASGARGRADRDPGIARVVAVDVGGIEVAGRGGRARREVVDTAGLDHRPDEIAIDHCSVVPAGDGDGYQLLGVANRRDGERVGQRVARH